MMPASLSTLTATPQTLVAVAAVVVAVVVAAAVAAAAEAVETMVAAGVVAAAAWIRLTKITLMSTRILRLRPMHPMMNDRFPCMHSTITPVRR